MSDYSYSPVVKGKAHDIRAYKKALESDDVQMKALIDVLPVPAGKTVDEHIEKLSKDLGTLPIGVPLFVDLYGFMPGQMSRTGRNATIEGYHVLFDAGRVVTPVYGFGRNNALWPIFAQVVRAHRSGFCFRIELEDLDDESENTWDQILTRSAELGLGPRDIDLFVDLRDVRSADVDEMQSLVTDFLAMCPAGIEYRTVCVAGSSASKDVTAVARDTLGRLYRNELKIWARLKCDVPACVDLVYGDYGIVHPDFAENVPCGGTVNCKIRYTAGSSILVFRGHVRAGDSGQTHGLAAQVVAHPTYQGPEFSAGDAYIAACSAYEDGPGNPGTWVFVDLNHHYVYVARQIDRLVNDLEIDSTAEEIDLFLEEV
jgi:hypothetical protein